MGMLTLLPTIQDMRYLPITMKNGHVDFAPRCYLLRLNFTSYFIQWRIQFERNVEDIEKACLFPISFVNFVRYAANCDSQLAP